MGWKSKFIFLLIVYFAGFATAVYNLAPAPQKQSQTNKPGQKNFVLSDMKSDEFVKSFNEQMHKCVDWGKEQAAQAGKIMKQKLNERQKTKS